MVKVLFDHQKFSEQRYGGITRYFAGLIAALKQHPDFDYQLSALYSNNYYIRKEQLPLSNALGKLLLNDDKKRQQKWNKQYSKYLISKADYDVFHPTYFHPYFLSRVTKPYVLTVHDMIYEALPDYFTNTDVLPRQKKQTVERAASVIAISESTKKDLMQFLDVPEEKIAMIHHGLDVDAPLVTEPAPALPEHFILYVGERGNYKNFFRFAQACAELMSERPDLHLILAGGGPLQVADALVIDRLKFGNRCRQIDASDAQLNYLYQKATVFVFPSLYEGFGYPLLEAFKAGCPVAASNTSCFPEIGGDAVAYFNPYDAGGIYKTVREIIDDSTLRERLAAKGPERLKLFPIQKQAEQTLELYKKVAGSKLTAGSSQ